MTSIQPLVLINAVGMTSKLLAHAPFMQMLATTGWVRPLRETLPAVTCTAQASILTGKSPQEHGIVANGWLFRDTMEVRFWQQSNRLLQAEPFYVTARREAEREGRRFRCAKLFWWFNQGADVDFSVTPKPHYGADGNKVFGITGHPEGLCETVEKSIGKFPFPAFWGPKSDLPSTAWIAKCAAKVVCDHRPELTLVYLPHLDYEPQRYGPDGCALQAQVRQLDDCIKHLSEEVSKDGARLWIVSEYGHCDVEQPVYLNRELRRAGWLQVRPGPFGEQLDTFASAAFAVCDHQLAHVYVNRAELIQPIRQRVAELPGVGRTFVGQERAEIGLDHPRSGEIVVVSQPKAWFAYPFWLEDRLAPDFARCIDIHRKPGFDPCELFFDPKLLWPMGRAIRRLVQKKLGFRTLFDVIPLDASLVKGSHGLAATHEEDRPLLIGDGPMPGTGLSMLSVKELVLSALRGN